MKEIFISNIAEAIEERFGKGYSVQPFEIVKNGNTVVPVAVISEPGATTSVAVHIGEMLEKLGNGGTTLMDAVWKVVGICEEVQNVSSYVDMVATPGKVEILRRVTYHLVNTEKNAGKLACCPHKEMLDFSAVYKAVIKDDGIETASIIVGNEICGRLGISEKELDYSADVHTDFNGFRTVPFDSVFPGALDGTGIDASCLWWLKNRTKDEGASIMLYPGYFGKLARRLGSDLYAAIPSSQNGVVAAPVKSGITPGGIMKAADKVSAACPVQGEAISENVYKYRHRTGKWEVSSI